MRSRRLRPALGDTIVSDHRGREADDLLGIARIRDHLLIAGHRRCEYGLADRETLGRDRLTAEDRSVLECEEARHAPCTNLPAAIVARTRPLTVSPSSHEFTERERKPSSVMR